MNEILYEKVTERAGKSQVLVFVHSRKDTVKTARVLKETAFAKDELSKFLREDSVSKKVLDEVLEKEDIKSPELRELLEHGFGVHHAGLSRSDRDLVE
jgi:pre-mRNA-splicing helicase BRR2